MNRCDVSGTKPVCRKSQTGDVEFECSFAKNYDGDCYWITAGRNLCSNLAAIRAAIVEERVDDVSKTMEEEWMKKKHSDCKHFAMDNKEEPCASCWERSKWDPK